MQATQPRLLAPRPPLLLPRSRPLQAGNQAVAPSLAPPPPLPVPKPRGRRRGLAIERAYRESRIWASVPVRVPLVGNVGDGVFLSILTAALLLVVLLWMPRVAWLPSLLAWPTYGLVFHLPHLAHFALALGAEAVQNVVVLQAVAFLVALMGLLDVYASVVLVAWVGEYYAGALDPATRAGIPAWQMLVLALTSIVYVVVAVLNFMRFVSAISAVRLYRIYYGLEKPDDAPADDDDGGGDDVADNNDADDENTPSEGNGDAALGGDAATEAEATGAERLRSRPPFYKR